MSTGSPLETLAKDPHRFGFDAAIRILLHAADNADPAEIVRFRSVSNLAYPPADVLGLRSNDGGGPPDLTVSIMGLAGATGVLPRSYSEAISASVRARSDALHEFLDLLSHRLVALFARAGTKYRGHRIAEIGRIGGQSPDPFERALLSLTGYGTGGLTGRLGTGTSPLLHYAGFFAAHPRSVDRLRALLSDWLGRPVAVRQFVGAWLPVPADQQTRLPGARSRGQYHQLGEDAVIGVRSWNIQAGIVLEIGPLDRAGFAALLPDRPTLRRLVGLVRAYIGMTLSFAVNPTLMASEVPPLRLSAGADAAPRLGWNTWLCAPAAARKTTVGDAVFAADVVEAQPISPAGSPEPKDSVRPCRS